MLAAEMRQAIFYRYWTNNTQIYVRSSQWYVNIMRGGDIPVLINFNIVYARYDTDCGEYDMTRH